MPYVETNGIETYYERHGDGWPIVCVPGGGWDHRSWYPQVEGLSDEFELILYDPRGHGRTEYVGNDEISVDRLAADLDTLIQHLELEQPAVMGCSLGGMIAHSYATANPSDVGALITLEAPTGLTDVPLLMGLVQRMQVIGSRFVGVDRLFAVQRWINSFVGEGDQWADQSIPGLDMTKGEYLDEVAAQMNDEVMMRMTSILQHEATELDSITAPALLLTGAESNEFFEDEAKLLAEEIPNTRRKRIPDAGHGANLDNPDAFNETVKEFLTDVFGEREQTVPS
jgi:pimeloyl-ACP methyl ester carboxylesterase